MKDQILSLLESVDSYSRELGVELAKAHLSEVERLALVKHIVGKFLKSTPKIETVDYTTCTAHEITIDVSHSLLSVGKGVIGYSEVHYIDENKPKIDYYLIIRTDFYYESGGDSIAWRFDSFMFAFIYALKRKLNVWLRD